jgi:tRNA(fMet)-specific endonuclease VapC
VAVIVADTDVLIDALCGQGEVERVAREIRAGVLSTTVLSVFELLVGARSEAQRARIEDLLAGLRILPLDEAAGRRAATVRRALSSKGPALPLADSLIAGICLAHDAPLLTRNRAHFERVEALRLA